MIENKNKYRKIRKIRDVIYDYIEITPIEERIINSKDFQRLRHISQNSLAYFTYPSNTTNRFSHSLGVMHLGGKMFIKALNNSESITLKEFISDSKIILEFLCKEEDIVFEDLVENWITTLGNFSGFNHLPLNLTNPEWLTKEELTIINILWQSVRIGCILHDIGHYPYSHLFEFAFKKFQDQDSTPIYSIDEKYKEILKNIKLLEVTNETLLPELPLHEMNGVILLDNLRITDIKDNNDKLSNLCLKLGKILFIYNKSDNNNIVLKKNPNVDKVLECLHTIISSDIDADRLDYCMRDPNNSGMELGAYDLQRIIDSTVFKKKSNNEGYEIVFNIVALSAIEEFFHQRFLMYEYLIFHHNVLRLDGTLEYVILELLKIVTLNKDKEVLLILEKHSLVITNSEQGKHSIKLFQNQFYQYDDAWFKTLLMDVFHILEKREKNSLFYALELVLFRNTNHIFSLWKRTENGNDFLLKIKTEIEGRHNIVLEEKDIINEINELFDNVKVNTESNVIKTISDELHKKKVVMIFKNTKKKIFKDAKKNKTKVLINNKVKSVVQASKYLESLKFCTENVINYNFFFISENIKHNDNTINESKEVLLNNLIKYIINKKS